MDYLERVERQLDLPPSEKAEVMKELRTHYEEFVQELVVSGMDQSQAEEEAALKFGQPEDIAAEMSRVHTTASWQTTALAAVPFIFTLLLVTVGPVRSPDAYRVLLPIALGFEAMLVAGVVRELRHDRRPVWLATWLPSAVALAGVLITSVARLGMRTPSYAALRWEIAAQSISYLVFLAVGMCLTRKIPKLQMTVIVSMVCVAAIYVLAIAAELPALRAQTPAVAADVPAIHGRIFSPPPTRNAIVQHPGRPVITTPARQYGRAVQLPDRFPLLYWLNFLSTLASTAAWIAIALAVFAQHRRSSAHAAALCLFALGASSPGLFGRSVIPDPSYLFWYVFLRYCLPIGGLVIFCWARDWRVKIGGLAAGVAAYSIWQIARTGPLIAAGTTMLITAVVVGRVILVPLYFERWRQNQKPEIAT